MSGMFFLLLLLKQQNCNNTEVKIYMNYIGKSGYYFRKFDNMHILSDMLRKDDDFIPVIFVRLLLGKFFYKQA